jgi:hypothetical protein
MAKNRKIDVEDACPFPPGIELPKKDRVETFTNSIRQVDWRVAAPVFSLGLILLVYGLLIPLPILITFPKEPEAWGQTIAEQPFSSPVLVNWSPKYSKQIVQKGDLFLKGNESLVLENCTYILKGFLVLSDNASLTMKNAEICMWESHSYTFPGPIPTSAEVIFTNSSRLEASNSYTSARNSLSIAFLDGSSAHIQDSNFTFSSLYGDDNSQITLERTQGGWIWLASNSSCVVLDSSLLFLGPGLAHYDHPLLWYNVRADVYDSTVDWIKIFVNGSSVDLSGELNGKSAEWDPSQLCQSGEWFNVKLYNSEFKQIYMYADRSQVNVQNSKSMAYLLARDSVLNLTNSSIPLVWLSNSTAVIRDSVIGFMFPRDSSAIITRCLLEKLQLSSFNGALKFDQVKTLSLDGNGANGTILGDLQIVNIDPSLSNPPTRLKRGYNVLVEAEGKALQGVALSLQDKKGVTVWKGETDNFGRASFNLTYYYLWRLAPFRWADNNLTSTLTLTAKVGQTELSRNITLGASTPIVFSFDKVPDPSIWVNKPLMMLSGSAFMVAAVGFVAFDRFRKRKS